MSGAGGAGIVWGAELFAEHLAAAAARLGITSFALALLLAGAEPEELATAVAAARRGAPGVAFGDVVGANVTISLVALGAAAAIATVPFGRTVRGYALGGLAVAAVAGVVVWDGLTLVGFATAFELVVLAWSTARRGMPETVVAAVVGSFAYNVTMTLGAAAVAHPLRLADADLLRKPWLVMVASLALVVALSLRCQALDRRRGLVLLALYPVFVTVVVVG